MSRFVEAVIATAARSARGMVTGEPDQPLTRSWAQLHTLARRYASGLAAAGLRPGQAVAVLAGQPAEVAPMAQAIWLAGGSLTMLHQPTPRTDLRVWRDDTVRVLRMIGAELVLIGAPFEPMADELQAEGIKHLMIAEVDGEEDFPPVEVTEQAVALLQLTSGSTAEPKAVRITHANLHANLTDAAAHLECDERRDTMVSWLPLFHDMGMVGCLLLPMFSGIHLVAVTPTDFLTRPLLWAELMSRHRGTITTAPNFAWAILARQLERAQGLDLSSMRITANGAEPVDPATMAAFVSAAQRFGLDPATVNCCYGAAESTLVISMAPLHQPIELDTVSADALERHRQAVPASPGTPGTRSLPLLGKPFPTVQVRVVDGDGTVLGERQVGHLQLRGASVTQAYLTEQGLLPAVDDQGWLDIGDEGYLTGGQVVVCGRLKDVIIMAGRNIYPTDIERAAASVPGVREGNVVAVRLLAGDGVARESFAVLAESRLAGDAQAEAALAEAVTAKVIAEVDARPARVVVLPPGSLPKTPSGKLRRAAAGALAKP